MNTITVGVLGAGRIGRLHTENLSRMSGVRVKSIADPYVDFGSWPPDDIETGGDPSLVLDDPEIDAVLICSPTPTHASLTEAAAAAGKHVFCEKPISLKTDAICLFERPDTPRILGGRGAGSQLRPAFASGFGEGPVAVRPAV